MFAFDNLINAHEYQKIIQNHATFFRNDKVANKFQKKISMLPIHDQKIMYTAFNLGKNAVENSDWKQKQKFVLRLFQIFEAKKELHSNIGETKLKKFLSKEGLNTSNEFKNFLIKNISEYDAVRKVKDEENKFQEQFNELKKNLKEDESIFLKAADKGYLTVVKKLIAQGANVNEINKKGRNALMLASWYGHTDVVKFLIKAGVNVNHYDSNASSALMDAAYNGHISLVDLLLKSGANINALKESKYSALRFVFEKRAINQQQCIELTDLMLKNGADLSLVFRAEINILEEKALIKSAKLMMSMIGGDEPDKKLEESVKRLKELSGKLEKGRGLPLWYIKDGNYCNHPAFVGGGGGIYN